MERLEDFFFLFFYGWWNIMMTGEKEGKGSDVERV